MVQTIQSPPTANLPRAETAATPLPVPTDFMEIISTLRRRDMTKIADRLTSLHEHAIDDPDDAPMNIESARHLASFILSDHGLGNPLIGMNPDGILGATWRLDDRVVIDIEFPPVGKIRYAALGPRPYPGALRRFTSGQSAVDDALREIHKFISTSKPK